MNIGQRVFPRTTSGVLIERILLVATLTLLVLLLLGIAIQGVRIRQRVETLGSKGVHLIKGSGNSYELIQGPKYYEATISVDAASEPEFEQLQHFPELRIVIVRGGTVSQNCIDALSKLDELERLIFQEVDFGAVNLQGLVNCQSLDTVTFAKCDVSKLDSSWMRELPRLNFVSLAKSEVSPEFLDPLLECEHLTSLNLSSIRFLGMGIRAFSLIKLTRLETLTLNRMDLTEFDFDATLRGSVIRKLDISRSTIRAEDLDQIKRGHPFLEIYTWNSVIVEPQPASAKE